MMSQRGSPARLAVADLWTMVAPAARAMRLLSVLRRRRMALTLALDR